MYNIIYIPLKPYFKETKRVQYSSNHYVVTILWVCDNYSVITLRNIKSAAQTYIQN